MKPGSVFVLVLISSFVCGAAIGAPEGSKTADAASALGARTTESPKLPLDHGPHAVTTPWVNQQRLAALAVAKQGRPSDQVGVAKSQ